MFTHRCVKAGQGLAPSNPAPSRLSFFSLPGPAGARLDGLVDLVGSDYFPSVDFLLHRRQCGAGAAAALPCSDQSRLSPVPGPPPAAPRRHPLRGLRAVPDQPCPAAPFPGRPAAAKPDHGEERHAALPGGRVRGVRDGAQPDGRGAQPGLSHRPHDAGSLLRPGGHAAHHPAQPLLPNERREGSVGQRAPQSQRVREKAQFQSSGVHLGVLSRSRQRVAHQGRRATGVQMKLERFRGAEEALFPQLEVELCPDLNTRKHNLSEIT